MLGPLGKTRIYPAWGFAMAKGCFSPLAPNSVVGEGSALPREPRGLPSPFTRRSAGILPASQAAGTAALHPWRLPARGLALFHGEADTARLSHYFLPRLLLRDRRVLFLDGANSADPRLLERLARQRGADFRQLCRNLQIARAFTCFQLTELIARVPQFLCDFSAEVVIVTAFPELYFDEDIRDSDARASFQRALRDLQRWAGPLTSDPSPQGRGAQGLVFGSPPSPSGRGRSAESGPGEDPAMFPVAVAVFSTASQAGALPAPARRHFFPRLLAAATEVWRFSQDAENRLRLTCTRQTLKELNPELLKSCSPEPMQ